MFSVRLVPVGMEILNQHETLRAVPFQLRPPVVSPTSMRAVPEKEAAETAGGRTQRAETRRTRMMPAEHANGRNGFLSASFCVLGGIIESGAARAVSAPKRVTARPESRRTGVRQSQIKNLKGESFISGQCVGYSTFAILHPALVINSTCSGTVRLLIALGKMSWFRSEAGSTESRAAPKCCRVARDTRRGASCFHRSHAQAPISKAIKTKPPTLNHFFTKRGLSPALHNCSHQMDL